MTPNLALAVEEEQDAHIRADDHLRAQGAKGQGSHLDVGVRDLEHGPGLRIPHVPQADGAIETPRDEIQVAPLASPLKEQNACPLVPR